MKGMANQTTNIGVSFWCYWVWARDLQQSQKPKLSGQELGLGWLLNPTFYLGFGLK